MDDRQIIELYWERSEMAISETITKYGSLFKRIAMNVLFNDEDVNECLNDSYLGAWNAIPPAKPQVLSAYLCRIVRNIALKKYNYYHAKKRNPEIEISLTELEECVSGTEKVEQEYETKYLGELISEFLCNLDRASCNVFLRRYWFFDSISQISKDYYMSESKVKSMLYRTRNKLKDYLIKEGVEF
ncbi:MAG: sigma-70 family RNA polymerase sigma factor [Oscillospiraceae bacterium]|nr:sigma-70 family RNA polymerase sigma factor [Desulfitobacteriaceae bacterium]MDD3833268.1 sigma-70 family RNA polymerase sigma factor [Oscillospiraceae bacterium]MDD4546295.1 sigma-70 family RNA polymerase sigma factor [Oscillospiraceae bacterium]